MKNPSLKEWANLYQITDRFKSVAPWQWVQNEGLFSVVNPENGQVGYCLILGSAKKEFGLGVFQGEKGYRRYLNLITGESGSDDFTESIMTPAITLLFADHRDLQKEDLEIIRSLGLKYRGRSAWPLFRSQKPGYVPWFIDKDEALFLTVAIEQALVVADKVRNDDLDLYEEVDDDLVFTRYYSNGEWREGWRRPELPPRDISTGVETTAAIVNEAEMLLLRNASSAPSGGWELDIFIMPVPIGPKSGRPTFPLCFLVVETKLGTIINTEMMEPWSSLSNQRDVFIQILKKAERLPRSIRVKSNKVAAIMEPVTTSLGIRLQVGEIPLVEEAKSQLSAYLSGPKG
jgi:hypothetical protein